MKFMHKERNKRNPNYCNACDKFLAAFPGGADVQLSIVFVDVRESTKAAEHLDPAVWGGITKKFYDAVCNVFYRTDGFVMDVIGDEVIAIYPPGFCGPEHAKKAIEAVHQLLAERMPKLPDGTPLQIGIGVNTGLSYVGSSIAVPHRLDDVRIFGDSMNTAARLTDSAGPGEALIAEAAWKAAGYDVTPDVEERQVIAKGKERPIAAMVVH